MKRLIAYLLVLSTFFSLLAITPVFADDADYNMEDVEYAADVLSGLNIYSKSSSASSQITRIEFITALYEIINGGDIFAFDENNTKHITDVSDADKKYVELALKKGLIKNPVDGKFNPEGSVDIDFAAYAFVAMTGYFQDLQNGMHLNRAQMLGLLEDVRNYKALTYADFVLMLHNMLDAHFLEHTTYGSENQFMVSDETVLEYFFGLEKFNARLVANSYTDLSNTLDLSDGYIALQSTRDGIIETYKCNYEYSEDLLGRNLTIYYDKTDKCVVYMLAGKKDKCLAEIDGNHFVEFYKNDRRLYYQKMTSGSRWEETYKTVYVNIPVDVDVIYNGQFTQEHTFVFDILEGKSDLNIGKVEVYDIDGDSKADLLKVDAYRNILVEAVSETEKTISDALTGTRVVLDENVLDGIVKIKDSSGETTNLSAIMRNDVVSVYSGRGKNPLITVVACREIKSEYLVARLEKDGRQHIKTENTQYVISAELVSAGKSIALGREVKVYLDHLGCIVKVAENDTVYDYIGSVVKMELPETFSQKMVIQIYTANGEFVTYTTANKLYVDDQKVNVDNDNWTYVDKKGISANLLTNLRKGIIQFKVNSKNEINRIYFPGKENRDGIIMYSNAMAHPEDVFDNPKKYSLRYKTNGKYFIPNSSGTDVMNFVVLDSGAKILTVPSNNILVDREKYYKLSGSLKNDTKAAVVGYTFEKGSLKSDLVVVVNEGSVSMESSSYYIVKDVYDALNSDGIIVSMVECMNSTGNISTFAGEGNKIPQCDPETGKILNDNISLAVGDVIKVALSATGEISAIGKMYDSESKTGTLLNPTYWYANKRFVYASVYDVDDNAISYVVGKDIVSDNVATELNVVGLNSDKVVLVKQGRNGKIVEYGSLSEVIGYKEATDKYSKAVFAGAYGETSLMVFYLND